MTRDPIFAPTIGPTARAQVWGAEYVNSPVSAVSGDRIDVPCAVCVTPRNLVLMVPGRNLCDDGWKTEYTGYLAGGRSSDYRTEFICIDSEAESNPQGNNDEDDDAEIFPAQSRCGALPCGPYEDFRDLRCAVCSR